MDPSALGTTIIGLDKIRHDDARYERAVVRRASRRRFSFARHRLADALRQAAALIEPRQSRDGSRV